MPILLLNELFNSKRSIIQILTKIRQSTDSPKTVSSLGKCRSIACMTDCGSICSRSVCVNAGTTCSNVSVYAGGAGANWPQDGVQ